MKYDKGLILAHFTTEKSKTEAAKAYCKNVGIEYRNLSDNYAVQGTNEMATKVTINLKGVDAVINSITTDDVSAYIDLSGLGEGEYEVDVKVEGTDSKIQYLFIKNHRNYDKRNVNCTY